MNISSTAELKRVLTGGVAIIALLSLTTPSIAEDEEVELDTLVLNNYNKDQFAEAADRNSSIYISKQAIDLAVHGDLKDVFAEEASVSVGGGIPIAQKMFVNGLDMLNLNVTIDGTQQNNRAFHHVAANSIDPGLLKAVRVDAGVAAADFGPNAIGGSVAFQTVDALDLLEGDDKFGGYTTLSYDSNSNTFTESVALYGQNAGFDILGYFMNTDGDDYETGNGWTIPGTAADLQSYLLKGGYTSLDGDRLEATAQVLSDDAIRGNRANFGGLNGESLLRRYDTLRESYSFRYVKEDATGFWDPEITLGYSENSISVPEYYPRGSTTTTTINSLGVSNTLNGKIANTFHLDDENTITAGGDFYVKTSNYTDTGPTDLTEKSSNIGVFTQVRLQPFDPLKLSFGGRYDAQRFEGISNYSDDVDGFSGNASAAFEIFEGLTLKAGYANVFGGIGLEDNYTFSSSWDYTGLQAARSESVTGGFEYKYGDFSFETEIFQTKVENARSGVGNTDFKTEGFNVSAQYNWLSGHAKITYSNTDISVYGATADGYTALDFAAPLGEIIAINVAHELDQYNLTLGANLDIALDYTNNGPETTISELPGYTVASVYAEYEPERFEGLTLSFEVNNIFDEDYADRSTYGQDFVSVDELKEPGRSFMFKLKKEF
ncbi:MAG: TonB-dependent receptor [Lentilitoribacter sp.]